MRNLLIILCIFSLGSVSAQEWGTVKGNKAKFKEVAPIWPGCEGDNVAKRDHCFNQKLATHIATNFRYPADEYKTNVQGKVVVVFVVNTEGEVEIRDVSGGNKGLQAEAERLINSIPKMSRPGFLAGKPREIEYTVPINFKTGK